MTLIIGLILIVALLAGCTETNEPITTESEGFWNQYIVYPLSQVIDYFAEYCRWKLWLIDYYCNDCDTTSPFTAYD